LKQRLYYRTLFFLIIWPNVVWSCASRYNKVHKWEWDNLAFASISSQNWDNHCSTAIVEIAEMQNEPVSLSGKWHLWRKWDYFPQKMMFFRLTAMNIVGPTHFQRHFCKNGVTLLLVSMWNVQWEALAIFSKTDQHDCAVILLCWFMHVSWQFGNEMSGGWSHSKATYCTTYIKLYPNLTDGV